MKKSKDECKEEPKEEPKEAPKEEEKVNKEKPQVVFLLGGPGSGMCEEA